MDIMEKVTERTCGRVGVGPGTLYNLLEQFVEAEMIRETKVEGRRRSYILTEKGHEVLQREVKRLRQQLDDYMESFAEESSWQ